MIKRDKTRIGSIGNYYGGLEVRRFQDTEKGICKYHWGIENYSGMVWEEIPEYLAKALFEYENNRY